MGTYILDKKKVLSFRLDPKEYNVLIRITNPRSKFEELKDNHIYREIITMRFYDFADASSGLDLFNENHLMLILEFFERHKHCRNLVVHCDEGRSRSAGVAVGWFLFNDVKSSIYKLYHDGIHYPNRRVVEFFYKHFKANILSIDKWEKEMFG